MNKYLILFIFLCNSLLYAENRLVDLNGDCAINGLVVGDSFVAGVGDNGNLGYVKRAASILHNLKLNSYGVPGLKASSLLSILERDLISKPSTKLAKKIFSSDFIILDLGRNDRWNFGEPSKTARDLVRIRRLIQSRVLKEYSYKPLVIIANLMLPNRGSQGQWVSDLNKILYSWHSRKYPSDLRFDLVSKRLLSEDQLHPSPFGHQMLSDTLTNYIKRYLPRYLSNGFYDSDRDGFSDSIELIRLGLDPFSLDSDGDGVNDRAQICGSTNYYKSIRNY